MKARRLLLGALACLACLASPGRADEPPLPSLAELEAAGAVIGEIRIDNQDIFDLNDPKENNAAFRLVNLLHIRTQPSVIRRTLLFKSGDPVSVRVIEETERLMRSNRYLYDVRIRPVAVHDNVADLEVTTRDTWTLSPGANFRRSGGKNSSGVSIVERNLLGTGTHLGVSRTSDVDRSSREFSISQDHAFDGWTLLNYSRARNSDGSDENLLIDRPFYALDTRWAAGVKSRRDDRLDSVYKAGVVDSQFRHRTDETEAYGGWSAGLQEGWVHRFSLGMLWRDESFANEPGLVAPAALPIDQNLVAPFFRHELIEDDTAKLRNRNQIDRPEYFPMGFASKTTVYRATTALNSSRNLWLYETKVANGFVPAAGDALLASAELKGQFGDSGIEKQAIGTVLTYYHPHSERSLFFTALSADTLRHAPITDKLLLGGDNGLRGYPLRYQSGINRVLVTAENRFYTDWFPFRLFRVGAAMFVDYGRAWGGSDPDPLSQRWLGDYGVGLRIASVRAAFGNVLHLDLAMPINPDPGIKKVQFLVKTKVSY